MKLYFSPGACSLNPRIVLGELGLPFTPVRIDGKTHKTEHGDDFYQVNPKGQVPTLETEDGHILTEGAVIVQYLADKRPKAKLLPPTGTWERYKALEWLSFVATEIHKNFSPLFISAVSPEGKAFFKDRLAARFDHVERQLSKTPYLMGEQFTVADSYLFTVLRWAKGMQIDLHKWPGISAFMERMRERPAVKTALAAEGLS
jgi:glutathione S-transferase